MLQKVLGIIRYLVEGCYFQFTFYFLFSKEIKPFLNDFLYYINNKIMGYQGVFKYVYYQVSLVILFCIIYTLIWLFIDAKFFNTKININISYINNVLKKPEASIELKGYVRSKYFKLAVYSSLIEFCLLFVNIILVSLNNYSVSNYYKHLKYMEIKSIIIIFFICIIFNFMLAYDSLHISRLRSRFIKCLKNGSEIKKPIYVIISNIDTGLSSFSREIKPFEFIDNSTYILLSETEFSGLVSQEDIFYYTSLIVYLIDPYVSTDEYINKVYEKFTLYNGFPHIKHLGLIIEGKQIISGWNNFIKQLSTQGELKNISNVIDKSNCLKEYLINIDKSNFNLHKVINTKANAQIKNGYGNLKSLPELYYLFIKNLLCNYTLMQLYFGLFDIVDLGLRLSCFSNIMMNRSSTQKHISLDDLDIDNINSIVNKIEEEIVISTDSIFSDLFTTEYPSIILNEEEIRYLEKYLNCSIRYNNITLKGLTRLLTYIRNKTKGHGRISEDNLEIITPILFKLMVVIIQMLHLEKLDVRINKQGVSIGVNGKEYDMSPFIIIKNDKIYFFQQTIRKKYFYINYNSGEFIRPTIEEILGQATS